MIFGSSGRHRAARSLSDRTRRPLAVLTIASLGMLGSLVLQDTARAAAPTPGITVTKSAPASVLAGETVDFTLTASNPSSNTAAQPEYNTSLRDVLPLGVTYKSGSTTPTDLGEPTIVTDANGQQTLIWRDAFDLQVGATSGLTFTANVDNSLATGYPVGSTILNTGNAYASTAPRYVPRFDATGAPVANSNVQTATSNQTSTNVSALKITKAEPSPENKLLRGVHDQTTVYRVDVTNTSKAPTNATTVTDYLPAQLEFLGCGQVDNSAGVEYPGAPSLTGTPAVSTNCPTPVSVATVANPPADGAVSYPAGIYTKVVWNLGTLAAGQTVTIRYAAGVPLRANALFVGGPAATSLGQTANLDNNSGPSTRQIQDAAAQTNYVHAAGAYTGPIKAGGSANVVADGSKTVTVNDLRVYKSVSPGEFVAGQVATYTLHVDSGEYTDNSAITITDVLPNGVCPLDDVSNKVTGTPAECNSSPAYAPSLPYQSVTQNADGTFTVVFQPIAVAKDGSTVITYKGRNRTAYTGGSLSGMPPAAGDSFTNHASEQGTSTPIAATGFTGTQTVQDSTSATQTTSFGSLDKTVGARATPMDCAGATYGTTNPVFAEGDRVCFQIQVPFSTTNQTRNAVVTDFLPDNTAYEAGSVTYPAANTVAPAQVDFDASGAASGALSWKLGATQADGSTEVPVGKTFVARFSAIITAPAAGPAPDKPGNIVKLRTTNSAGAARSLRDGVDFRIAAAPPVSITKGVESVNGGAGNPANVDNVAIKEGDAVRFRLDVTNNGTAANANNIAVGNLSVWDVLPAGIACAQIGAISAGGTCTDPGDAGQPTFNGNGSRSAITWQFGGTGADLVQPGASGQVGYTMSIPAETRVATSYVNTGYVHSYTTATDQNTTATHYPANNVDTTVAVADQDVPAAADASEVHTPTQGLSKGVVSSINESNNVGAEASPAASTRATVGELVTYTVRATVPAGTTVYKGIVSDLVPAGQTLQGATVTYQPDANSPTTAALPSGVVFTASPPTLVLPPTYNNTTTTDQRFTIVIVARIDNSNANVTNGLSRTNTANFTSTAASTGNTAGPSASGSASVVFVQPAPSVAKTNDVGAGGASGGQTITYTLKPTNASGRPPLHDAWQLDCLPSGLTFVAYGTPPAGVTTSAPVPGNGSNGCASGSTVLAWDLGDLAGGQTQTLTYTATVDTTSSGKTSLVNTASVSGNSLAQDRTSPVDPGNPNGRQYSATGSSTVVVSGATAQKSVSPTTATVGQTVTYTTSAVLPAGVNFYNLSLIDTLPAGIDPASVTRTGTTCTNADSSPCTPTSTTALTPTAAANGATRIGWLLGDSGTGAQVRTVTVTYTASVADVSAATAGAGLTNRMHVSWDSAAKTPPTASDASYGQSSADATATVTVAEPSLSLAKTVSQAHPQPGQVFGYSLQVSNANTSSTSAAYSVTVTDAVPTGVVVDPATISDGGTIAGADASTGGGTITWTITGPLAKNGTTTLTYSASLAPSSTLTTAALSNTATITGYDSRSTGGRHYTGPASTAVVAPYFPAMTTAKSAPSGSTAFIGESFPWRVRVTNGGNGTAYAVGSVDTLPANWTYDAGSAQVSVNGGPADQVDPTVATSGGVQTLTWTGLGTLPAGTALTIDYTATPRSGVKSSPGIGLSVDQTNTATSSAQDATGATGNKSGTYGSGPATAVAHIASADLVLDKKVGTAPTAGLGGSWVVTVTNDGPDTATGPFTVTDDFTDPIPAGVSNVQASGTGWSCTNGRPISCTRNGTLAKDAALPPITVTYDVASTVADGRKLTNTASVSARSADPDTTNNADTAQTTVATSADIALDKQLSSTELVAGDPVSYRLAVSNVGPSVAAAPVKITDTVPAGTTFVSAGADGWTCDTPDVGAAAGTAFTCTLDGPLAVGGTPDAVVVTVQVASGRTTAVTNTASVTSATDDPDTDDNTDTVTTTPVVRADVKIQKTHLTNPFVAGDPVTYRFDVTNNGPSDATGVEVTDTLPDGLTYTSSDSDDDWTCSADGQDVTCDLDGSLPPGTSVLTITVDTAADLNLDDPIVNTAKVTTTTTDPVPGNNSDDDDSTVTAKADLGIEKTDSGATKAGEGLTYHLAVHNYGPSDVKGPVTVTDPLPAGLTYVSATGTGWDCGVADRVVTCTLAAGLADGADAAVIDVVTTVNSDVGDSTITNTADVGSDTPDPKVGNNSDDDPVAVTTEAALSLTKKLTSASPVVAGTDAEFTLVASNAGPSDASQVSVVDHLPQYLSYKSFTGTGWDCSATGQDVTCTRDTIAADTDAPDLVITAHVSASTPVTLPAGTTTLVNTADIDATTAGTNDNPDPVDVPVQAQADLTLTKKAKASTVIAGQPMTWLIDVHDDGPSDATGPLTVTDTLPGFQTFVSVDAPWSCTAGDVPAPQGPDAHQTVTCTLTSGLAYDGDAPQLAITTQVDTAAPAGDVDNAATVTSATPGDDGSDTGTVEVTRTAALKITKTHTGHGTVGGELAFTLGVHNDGPSRADQVVVTDALPTGLDYVSATGDGWTCAEASRTVTCTLAGTLASGADATAITLTTTVRAAAFPSVVNTAVVGSTDPALPGTSSADDTVTVDPSATLEVTKAHVGEFVVGEGGTYRLTVRNTGPTLTPGPVVLTDDLPTGLSYVDATGDGWTCRTKASLVTCSHAGGLAVDEQAVVTLTVRIGAAAYPAVTNAALATAPGAPPATGNDTAPVTPTSALAITKKVIDQQDGVVTYAIAVTDEGPNDTVDPVVVTDPLPAGLRFESATGAGWTCTHSGARVTCTHADPVTVGSTTTVTLRATVVGRPGQSIVNVASVTTPSRGVDSRTSSNPARIVVPPASVPSGGGDSAGGTADTGADVRASLALGGLLLLLGLVTMAAAHRGRRRTA